MTDADPPRARDRGPLIVACLRQSGARPEVDPLTGAVRRPPHGAGAAPAELAALELALRLAAAWSGRVLAVTAGPPAAGEMLRDALAVGAAALRVDWPEPEYLAGLAADEQPLAAALAAAIRPASPVLVLCGDRSADRGTGALPAFLAQELGVPQALGLVSLTWPDSPGAGMGDRPGALTGERRLPGGWRERLSIALPAVCSVEAAGIRLRRAPLDAVLAARRADLPVVIPDARAGHLLQVGPARPYRPRTHQVPAAPAGSARERLAELSGVLTQRDPPALIGPADPARAAEALLGYLRRNGFAQDAPVPDDKSSTDQPSPAGQGSPPDGGSSPDHGSPPEEVGSPDQASPPDPASPPDQASPPEPAGVNDAAGGQPADSRSARPPGPG